MYRVEFVTSRYLSFADHVAQRDPTTYVHAADAMGAPPASTPSAVLAARSADIAAAMTPAADPQQRQQLFAAVLSDIGLAELQSCDRLTLTRLTDSTGTTALLLESPEPLSFLHDVTPTLLHRAWRRCRPAPSDRTTRSATALSQLESSAWGWLPRLPPPTCCSPPRSRCCSSPGPHRRSRCRCSTCPADSPATSPFGGRYPRAAQRRPPASVRSSHTGAAASSPSGPITRSPERPGADPGRCSRPADPARNADETSTVMLCDAARLGLVHPRPRVLAYPLGDDGLDPASVYTDSATIPLTW